jgi:hypothetical protein
MDVFVPAGSLEKDPAREVYIKYRFNYELYRIPDLTTHTRRRVGCDRPCGNGKIEFLIY